MEQVVKLTGRIAEVFPIQSGVSQRGNEWKSQDYLFEYFPWSGAKYPSRIVCRIFGEEDIKNFDLQPLEENITLTFRFDANKSKEGRWFNEIRITNVEHGEGYQPTQREPENPGDKMKQMLQNDQQRVEAQNQQNQVAGEEKDDYLPF